ncbi:hypothetical protein [Streptomyces sp. SID12501]|uniref:Aminoglycoside phosphotransferase domain-containing protein n=1 Tax=Streptomyces sp. SID12501 TaxID=2706042 RepID=A0A6B3BL06_9ACTN|nr:hypothetical protein [Streptomyces sp. SID12501]NEC84712.1 hypothetical protein [Streptomyces sp. SID12501]
MTTPAPLDSEVINESGTGNQVTRVLRTPDGQLLWQRGPGRDNPEPYPPLPATVLSRLHTLDTPALRFQPPARATPALHTWHVNGRFSFAALMTPDQHDIDGRFNHLITTLGKQLNQLHATPPHAYSDVELARTPHSHLRLRDYLGTGRGPRAATAFHYRLRTQLGTARFNRLQEAVTYLCGTPDPHETVLLHGWCSLGSLVVPDPPHRQAAGPRPPAHMLTGSEVCTGRRESDLACLLGELTEYTSAARSAGLDWPLPDQLRKTFLSAYGDGFDPATLAAGRTARIATHALAVAAFHGWNEQLHGYIPMLAELLDHDGHPALTSG